MDELNGTQASMQTSQVMDLTGEEDAAAMRTAGHPSTSGRGETSDEGSKSLRSTTPLVEPIQSRQRGRSLVWISGILVY